MILYFTYVVLQRTTKKCTKNYNARVQPFFTSLNLLFGNVAVAVAVVVKGVLANHDGDGDESGTKRFNEQNNGCAGAF